MRQRLTLLFAGLWFLSLGIGSLLAQTPAATPDENPEGNTGALKEQVTTGGSYSAHSGNGTRIINDLHLPGALGVYGLDFTRYWNSLPNDSDNPYAVLPSSFGVSGWSHSWEWYAQEEDTSEKIDPLDDNSEEIFTTAITITFPDGHANRYKITRSNRGVYSGGVLIPGDPRCGPPYTVPEQNGFLIGGGVYDFLRDMAPDGSQFWLYRADGGAVHFINGPLIYQASEVYDPHGLHTALTYDASGHVTHVQQDGGRSLTITWGYHQGSSAPVIDRVDTGGYAGSQFVEYHYARFPDPNTGNFLVLSGVRYPGDVAPGQDASAIYTYGNCYGDEPCTGATSSSPLLKVADDPHYAGAMTKIRYTYQGSDCQIQDQPAPGFEPYPNAKLDYYLAQSTAIAAEKSNYADQFGPITVSSFGIGCFTGTRSETNGLGGWRQFYFGRSAGQEEASAGYQLVRLTDFTNQYPFPANLPFERQRGGDHPSDWWDGRNLRTSFVYADQSGQPSEVHHVTADGSVHRYDRVNPGASEARDPARIHSFLNHWVFSRIDERNLTTTYRRDSRRRVTDITYPDGNSEHFDYDTNGFNQVTSHRLPSGATISYLYDGRGLLLQESNDVDGPGPVKEYTYDELDRVKTVKDGRARANGKDFSTRMTYNGRHQALTVEYAGMNNGTSNPTVSYGYDPHGNCNSITDEMGHTSTYAYDDYRRCIRYTEPLNAPGWNGAGTVVSRRWDWIYDRYIDGVGLRGAYTHTANVWRIQIEPGFNAAGERKMTARWHDLQNRITLEQTGWIQPPHPENPDYLGDWYWSADGETHTFAYDENGNKKTYTDPRGRLTSYTYDLRNRLFQTIEPLNRVTATQYDTTGNKTLVTFPDNTTQQWLDYTPFGQAERFIDERGNTTNLNHKWGPMNKLASVVTHRDRDGGGTEDQPTTFQYDPMGRPTQVLFPDGSHEDSTYECGNGASYGCDQVHSWSTRKGQTKYVHYDARGREDSHSWENLNGACDPGLDTGAAPCIARTWDAANRLTNISNKFSAVDYQYDAAGQALSEGNAITGSNGHVVTNYSRYPNGDVAHLGYPDGFPLRTDCTARGQVKTVGIDDGNGNWIAQFVNYTYLADGKVDHQDYPHNGTSTAFGYDGRGFTNSVLHKRTATSQTLSSRTYARDSRDRINSWVKGTDTTINPMENGRGNRYAYDFEGQLTDAYYGALDPGGNLNNWGREDHFNYDALGNRRSWDYLASRGQWMNFTRKDNGLNEYRAWSPYSTINYDDDIGGSWGAPGAANGVIMQDGWITAGFNALNQPMYIWSGNVGWTYFGYDPLGRCVKRWVGSDGSAGANPATYLYYEGWSLIQEGPGAGTPDRIYVHGAQLDQILCSYQYSTGIALDFYYDAMGHCTLLIDDYSGNIWEQYDYDVFGKPYFYDGSGTARPNGSAYGTRFLFTGREWLSDLHLYDYRNRLYQPELGRFLQPDPKEFGAGDYNLYRYCHNDPVNKTDPDGLVDLSYTPAADTAHTWEDSFNPSDRFTVAGHANSQFIADQKGNALTPSQVAKDMIAKGFTPEKPVLLVGCETGKGENSFASKLANALAKLTGAETKVQAPTTKIGSGSTKGAEPTVQNNEKTGKPGELKTFTGTPPEKKLKKDQ